MEFLGCDSEGFEYDLFYEDEELDLPVGGLDKSQNMLIEFDLDSPFGLDEDVILKDTQVMERFQEVESSLSEVIGRPPETGWSAENLWVGEGIFSGDEMNVASPDCGLSSFSLLREYDESWSRNSSCGLGLNSSVLNSEMGRQEDESDEMSKTRHDASVVGDSSLLDKQVNSECSSSTKVTCQVQGCNADLTSSKDYYKRHRVCTVDTKKTEVIVNGIQKRFCQQCSRFHLLNEFDDDKRSCRKRLAGHNKRRRRPRFESHLHKPKFQLYEYQGTRLHGTAQPPRRHLSANSLPSCVLFSGIYEQINRLKPQSTTVYGPPSNTNFPSSRSHFLGAEYYTPPPPETQSTVPNPSGVLDASYALSLLSNPPQVSFPYFTTSPVIIQGHNIFHRPVPNFSFPSPHMFQATQFSPMIIPGTVNPVGFAVSGNHNAGSLCANCSNWHVPPQHGSNVNLRQLSFNLSSVEHQRHVP